MNESNPQPADKPSGKENQPNPPAEPKEDTPAGGEGGERTPPAGGQPSPSDDPTAGIVEKIKTAVTEAVSGATGELRGRLTKIEQRVKTGSLRQKMAKAKPNFSFEEPEPEPEPTPDEVALEQEKETVKVEKGISHLMRDAKYQSLLTADKTLADVLDSNPLALLKDLPVDAEDALEKLTEILDDRVTAMTPPEGEEGEPKTPPAPEAGPTNPPAEETPPPPKPEEKPKAKTPDEVASGLSDKIGSDGRLGNIAGFSQEQPKE